MLKFATIRASVCSALALGVAAAAFGTAAAALRVPSQGAVRQSTTEHIIETFTLTNGNLPNAAVITDKHGNLYGTTSYNGGKYGFGNVYELKQSKGAWKETVLHDFTGTDGAYPLSSLVFDAKGNLYGTAQVGGTGTCTAGSKPLGCGVAFELSPAKGGWTYTILYSFVPGQTKGVIPAAGLIMDKAGNLYGTTWAPGVEGNPATIKRAGPNNSYWGCTEPGCGGTVYELSPTASGWKETDLYAFTGLTDGAASLASLVFDAKGNLYGTTQYGGSTGCTSGYGCGVVFEVTPHGSASTEKVLHTFSSGGDGSYPVGSLLFDAAGNIYSTSSSGGEHRAGVVFELSPKGKQWTLSTLYTFTGGADGSTPNAALIADSQGNFYGTAEAGGDPQYPSGVAFELSKSGTTWTQTVLHTFTFLNHDGQSPSTALVFGPQGLLYGTTQAGGINHGTVFSVAP